MKVEKRLVNRVDLAMGVRSRFVTIGDSRVLVNLDRLYAIAVFISNLQF